MTPTAKMLTATAGLLFAGAAPAMACPSHTTHSAELSKYMAALDASVDKAKASDENMSVATPRPEETSGQVDTDARVIPTSGSDEQAAE